MKVQISTTQSCCNTGAGKPLSCDNSPLNTAFHSPISNPDNNNLCYEPTSVLDLQRSPSPGPASKIAPPPSVTAGDPSVDLDNLEAWDSILSELGFNDDNTHLPQLPDFSSSQPFDHIQIPPPVNLPSDYNNFYDNFSYTQNPNPNFPPLDHNHQNQQIPNFGLDFIDDLIRAAQSFESSDNHQVELILTRLNQRLRSPVGRPLQRAAFYFKEALQHLTDTTTSNSVCPALPVRLSSYEIVQTIRSYEVFSGISPIALFSTFTANQAILEAVDGSAFIHVLDFDIGFGGHWASFMRELVDKHDTNLTRKPRSIVLRITAIVLEGYGIESKLVRENLSQFARDLNINFHIDFVLFHSFEILSFKSVKFIDGEKLAIHLSAAVFHRLGKSRSGISNFLADLRGISPSSVVVVDREVGIDTGTSSFSVNFVAGIEFYTGMMESLEVAAAAGFVGGGDSVRRIENFVLRPRIMATVEAAATAAGRRMSWRETFVTAGMRAVAFSHFADIQAEFLLRRAQVGGFHVAKRHGEMMLCWRDRPLIATSAWRY